MKDNIKICACGTCGDNAQYNLFEDGTLIILGNSDMFDYDYINQSPFSNTNKIKKVIIENGIKSIGDSAFEHCSLTQIEIAPSVTKIGEYAFCRCEFLTSITIPNGVKEIAPWAFYDCKSLKSIKLSDTITVVNEYTFRKCKYLNTIFVSKSINEIENNYVFSECESLRAIEVDENNKFYKSIDGVLYDKNLTTLIYCPSAKTSIQIPDSITQIADRAFCGCEHIKSITIPNNITKIGSEAFRGCKSLISINIPDGVQEIEEYTFEGCESLTSIIIPNSVIEIGERIFDDCTSLTSIFVTHETMKKFEETLNKYNHALKVIKSTSK